MELINRDYCIITGKKDLELLYSFKDFPVYMGCVEHSQDKDLKTDMNWWISKGTGSIQLNPLIPLNILYPENHAGAIGTTWNNHHSAFAKFLNKFNPKEILEIGGAHGILSMKYQNLDDVNWTIVEPNPVPHDGVKAKFIQSFFDNSFIFKGEYDTIVHSHVCEHIYDPKIFIKHLSKFMTTDKKLIFSIPNMEVMLKRKYTNCINFEHTLFLTESIIEYILNENKFHILEKQYFLEDHSIFYACEKIEDTSIILSKNKYEVNKKIYNEYIDFHLNMIESIKNKIKNFMGDIYLFGAHIFAQYLLAFGLKEEKIIFILDNDKNKQNKRLYGTSLIVKSPEILRDKENVAVILRAGVYNNEIKNDILKNINKNVTFWE